MDIPRIVEEATRAAAAAGVAPADPKIGQLVEKRIEQQLAANQASLTKMAETLTREAASRADSSRVPVDVQGRNVEVAVQKDGRVIGRANAMLNMDRTLKMVLGFARRDQGEISFAIDRTGALYTSESNDKPRLQALGVERTALVAAEGTPRRTGRLDHRRAARAGRDHLRDRPADRRVAARNPARIGAQPGVRHARHRPGLHRHRPDLAPHDAAPRDPHERRASARRRRLPHPRAGPVEGRIRRPCGGVQPDGGGSRAPRGRRGGTGTPAPRARALAPDSDRDAAARPAAHRGRPKSPAFRFPPGRSAATSSIISCFRTAGLRMLVGDVSGKGVSAALLMANIQATLRARLPHETDLAQLADRLDRELDQNTPGGVYLTLFLAILETDGRLLRYVNAGHNPQFVVRRRGGLEALSSTGMPIALYAGHGYTASETRLEPGDLLFFYTDGLVEAENAAGDMIGSERLEEMLDGANKARRLPTSCGTSSSRSPSSAARRSCSTMRR